MLGREQPGEADATTCRGERNGELEQWDACGSGLMIHVTQRVHVRILCEGWRPVR